MAVFQTQRLGAVWPRLLEIPFAESLANLMLQTRASKRIHAEQALRHRYIISNRYTVLNKAHLQAGA